MSHYVPRRPAVRLAGLAAAAGLAFLALPAAAQQTAPAEAAPAAPAAPASPEVSVTRTDGDWQTVCAAQVDRCLIRQIGKTADGREIMEMSVERIPPQQTQAGTVESVLVVRVPLGVLLNAGLTIQIDSSEAQKGAFAICTTEGCLLREGLPNALIEAFKKGATAKISFAVPAGQQAQQIDATISLRGFTAAYTNLKPAG